MKILRTDLDKIRPFLVAEMIELSENEDPRFRTITVDLHGGMLHDVNQGLKEIPEVIFQFTFLKAYGTIESQSTEENKMKALINLNEKARGIVMDVFKGINLDTKDTSVRANIGNMIRKGVLMKTSTGGYALTADAHDFMVSITRADAKANAKAAREKANARKTKETKPRTAKDQNSAVSEVHQGFILMRGKRLPEQNWFDLANEIADKISVVIDVRTRGLYCGNFLLILKLNKNFHSFEVREKGLRILAKNEETSKKLEKIGLEVRPSTNGGVYYCDGSLKLVDKAIKILEKSL